MGTRLGSLFMNKGRIDPLSPLSTALLWISKVTAEMTSVQSPEPGLDTIIFIFLILGIFDSGRCWLLPLQTHPISQAFTFMLKHLLDFVDTISGFR